MNYRAIEIVRNLFCKYRFVRLLFIFNIIIINNYFIIIYKIIILTVTTALTTLHSSICSTNSYALKPLDVPSALVIV